MQFLYSVGLEQYEGQFHANNIDGNALVELTDAELRDDVGVLSLGHRALLLDSVKALRPSACALGFPHVSRRCEGAQQRWDVRQKERGRYVGG